MYITNLVAVLVASAWTATAASTLSKCTTNACLMQVITTGKSTRSHTRDCSTFLMTTTTPTVYATSTSTVYQPVSGLSRRDAVYHAPGSAMLEARSAISSSMPTTSSVPTTAVATYHPIPTYASSCINSAAYTSACKCIGITAVIISRRPVTSTKVVTVTVASARPSFLLQGSYATGTSSPKTYVATVSYGALKFVEKATANTTTAFVINDSNGMVAPAKDVHSAFYYYAPADRTSYPISVISSIENSYPPLVCSIAEQSKKFTCKYKTMTGVFVFCHGGNNDGRLAIAKDANSFGDTCPGGSVVALTAVPA